MFLTRSLQTELTGDLTLAQGDKVVLGVFVQAPPPAKMKQPPSVNAKSVPAVTLVSLILTSLHCIALDWA